MKQGIIIAFGELFLKSKGVKRILERKLKNNLYLYFKDNKVDFKETSLRERIFIETESIKEAEEVVKRVFGISWFAECFSFSDFKELLAFIEENYPKYIKKSFAIRMKKNREAIDKIAEIIDRKVDLNNPKTEVFVEKRKDVWFLYFKKQKGAGGIPQQEKALCLISGGIDSVPGAFLVAKRGGDNVWIHFHSFPLVSKKSIEKVEEMAQIFLDYQPKLKVFFAPLQKAQIEIKTKALPKYRVLLYRRLMLKISELIAKKENCKALVTGESLSQVSSQTLSNLQITEEAVKIPVLRPVIGFDKEEIIQIAQKIGVYDVSIKPQEDCCTLFVSAHQTAKGDIKVVKELEKKIGIDSLAKDVVKNIGTKIFTLRG